VSLCPRVKLKDVQELFKRIEQLEGTVANNPSKVSVSAQCGQSTSSGLILTPETLPRSELSGNSGAQIDESIILQRQSGPSPSNNNLPTPTSVQEASPACHLGQNWFCMGVPLFSGQGENWIKSKTGQNFSFDSLRPLYRYSTPLPLCSSLCIPNEELWRLPAREAVQEIAATFLQSPCHLSFPILDQDMLEMVLESVYGKHETTTPPQEQNVARVFVMAALSIITAVPRSDRVIYAAKAQKLMGYVTEQTSLIALKTVLMLVSVVSSILLPRQTHQEDSNDFTPRPTKQTRSVSCMPLPAEWCALLADT
jgi:hypothetical protein